MSLENLVKIYENKIKLIFSDFDLRFFEKISPEMLHLLVVIF